MSPCVYMEMLIYTPVLHFSSFTKKLIAYATIFDLIRLVNLNNLNKNVGNLFVKNTVERFAAPFMIGSYKMVFG